MPSKTSNSKPAAGRRKLALGKGLNALIPKPAAAKSSSDFIMCAVSDIRPNRYQPRIHFAQAELEELAASIKTQGVIQPLLVCRDGNGFELIAGERRLRAAKMAGLKKVPVVVKEVSETELLEMSLVENIQREGLNPLEEAEAYHLLMTKFDLTQDQAAERVGKSRSAVANIVRLRQLPEPIKAHLTDGTLSMGHARALLGAATRTIQTVAWQQIVAKKLSVRESERLIQRLNQADDGPGKKRLDPNANYFNQLGEDLSRQLGTKVQIRNQGKRGMVRIEYYSQEELERLIQIFKTGA